MKSRNEKLFLADIQECCQKIERYIEGISEKDFQANEILKDALVRNIEIIGEAAKKYQRTNAQRKSWHSVARCDANERQNCASLFSFETGNNLANDY